MANKGKTDSGGLTVKELKSMLDDHELDLSMRELTTIPVKSMAQIPKATFVDLSVNHLEVLPQDFASSLTHLTKLDLSQNRLVHLPDNFGDLRSLVHLDLYRNQLEELPLSFANLKQLKWLDLKDNPLEPALAKAAGDCLDEKQCHLAASRVLGYVQKIQEEAQKLHQKHQQKEREQAAAKQAKETAAQKEKTAAKKREKENRRLQQQDAHDAKQATPPTRSAGDQGDSPKKQRTKERNEGKKSNAGGRQKRSWCGWLMSWLKTLLLLGVSAMLLMSFAIYHNCSSRQKWLPQSAGLCTDLYTLTAGGGLPKTAHQNVLRAADGAGTLLRQKTNDLVQYVQSTDWSTLASDSWLSVRTQSLNAAQWTRKTVVDGWNRFYAWFKRDARPFLEKCWKVINVYAVWLFEQSKIVVRVLLEIAIDLTNLAIEKSSQLFRYVSAVVVDVTENREKYWEKAKVWWANMK